MSLGVKVPGGHGGGDHVPGEGKQLVKVASGWPGPRLCLGPSQKGGLTKASLSQAPHPSVPAALRAPSFSGGFFRADGVVTVVPSVPPPGVTVSLQEELPWRVFKEPWSGFGGRGCLAASVRASESLGLPPNPASTPQPPRPSAPPAVGQHSRGCSILHDAAPPTPSQPWPLSWRAPSGFAGLSVSLCM